jgi:hypothetical protein
LDEATMELLLGHVAILSSILAGFSFTVVVQLALAKERTPRPNPTALRASFIAFLICTVALVISVVAGAMLVFPETGRTSGEELVGTIWWLGMLIGAVSCGGGLIALGWMHSREFGILATIAGVVSLVLLLVILASPSPHSQPSRSGTIAARMPHRG